MNSNPKLKGSSGVGAGSATDHWWSRKPEDERRPILSSRLFSNVWEFQHPWKVFFAALGGLVVIGMILSGLMVARGSDDPQEVVANGTSPITAFETGPVQVSGTFLPGLSNPDPAVGSPVPEIDGISFDGEAISVGGDGAPRLYGFFAHWCPHCQAELPRVSAWLADNDPPGTVDLVAISTGVRPDQDNYPPSAWFEREAWPDDVIVDSDQSSIAQAFGLTAYPYWVGADSDGNVAFRFTGSLTDEQLVTVLDALAES